MQSHTRLLLPTQYVEMPWKNWKGVTAEIAKISLGEVVLWRLSLATCATNGPFSCFPGIDRVLTMVEGNGLKLELEQQNTESTICSERITLGEVGANHKFSGDVPCMASLVDGPVRNFNVMASRTAGISAQVATSRLAKGAKVNEDFGGYPGLVRVYLYCFAGTVVVRGPSSTSVNVPRGATFEVDVTACTEPDAACMQDALTFEFANLGGDLEAGFVTVRIFRARPFKP